MQKFILILVLLLLAATCMAENQPSLPPDKVVVKLGQHIKATPEQLEHMVAVIPRDLPQDYTDKDDTKVFVYNQAIAERFGLDPKKAELLDKGLYAIELVIKKTKFFYSGTVEKYFNLHDITPAQHQLIRESIPALEILFAHAKESLPISFHNECYLNLYVDSSLPILYPQDGEVGDFINAARVIDRAYYPILNQQINPAKEIKNPNAEKENFLNHYGSKVFLSSFAINHKGAPLDKDPVSGNPVYYRYYYKNFIYGMSYISLGPISDCKYLIQQHHPLLQEKTFVLLEKKIDKDYDYPGMSYSVRPDLNLDDFFYFKLPETIMSSKVLKAAWDREYHYYDRD